TARHVRPSSSAKADDPGTPGLKCWSVVTGCPAFAGHDTGVARRRSDFRTYAASAALAFSAIAWNAAGSLMARSDSTLRSTVMPDLERPLIKTLKVMPNGRPPAVR